jgi:hypothetical protein
MKSASNRSCTAPVLVPRQFLRPQRLATAAWAWGLLMGAGVAGGATVVIDDFAGGPGHFTSPPGVPTETMGIFEDSSSIGHDPADGHDAPGSLPVSIDDNPAVVPRVPWILRALSGGGAPANNVSFASTGFVGYWVKTTSPALQVAIVIDDEPPEGLVRSRWLEVIPDGNWHLYEWDLDATPDTEWLGDGAVDSPVVTIDSIFVRSVGAPPADWDAVFWVDDVGHNPLGSLVPEPAVLSLAALGGACLARRRRR